VGRKNATISRILRDVGSHSMVGQEEKLSKLLSKSIRKQRYTVSRNQMERGGGNSLLRKTTASVVLGQKVKLGRGKPSSISWRHGGSSFWKGDFRVKRTQRGGSGFSLRDPNGKGGLKKRVKGGLRVIVTVGERCKDEGNGNGYSEILTSIKTSRKWKMARGGLPRYSGRDHPRG